MFDFIIELFADIAELFIELWINKIKKRREKSNIDSRLTDREMGIYRGGNHENFGNRWY